MMVWAAVTETGKSPLVFVPARVKINTKEYISTIMEKRLIPWDQQHSSMNHMTFPQDCVSFHTSRETLRRYEASLSGFWDKTVWSPSV
uniref:Uncharacterized protein n=1 Tax=Lepeophtheirus salmonis TaxID=72036 RepID=A0A0K2UM97_LEPSM